MASASLPNDHQLPGWHLIVLDHPLKSLRNNLSAVLVRANTPDEAAKRKHCPKAYADIWFNEH
jgi:hypothetical protein